MGTLIGILGDIHVMSSYMWCHHTCDVILHVMSSYMWCHPTCDVMHMQDVINVWRNQINVLFTTASIKWWHSLECWRTFMWCHHTCDVIIHVISCICKMSSYVWRNKISVLFATALMKWGHSLECWRTWRERRMQMKHQQMWKNFSGKA